MEIHSLPSRVRSFSRSSSSMRSYDKLEQTVLKSPFASDPLQDDSIQSDRPRSRCFLCSLCSAVALIATITLSTILAVRARNSHGSQHQQQRSTDSAAIAAVCNSTMFPDLCYEWLSADPSAFKANPVQLAGIGVKVALRHVQDASALATKLNHSGNHVNLSKQAIEDCIELMGLSSDQLNDSIAQLSSISLLSIKSSLLNVKTKLSGTMGFQLACSEGLFEGLSKDGSLSILVQSQDEVSKGLIISLGLVGALSELGNDVSTWKDAVPKIHLRRLLSDDAYLLDSGPSDSISDAFNFATVEGFPDWLSVADRKLLQASPTPSTPTASSPPATPNTPSPVASSPRTTPSVPSPPATPSGPSPSGAPLNSSPPNTSHPPPPATSSPSSAPLVTAPTSSSADAVVAQDGSGNYKTIKQALDNVPSKRTSRYTIYIKKGTYNEYVVIPKSMKLLTLVGDGMGQTIISGDKSNQQGFTTYQSATVAVSGTNFIARKITFRNTAGPAEHQAVALRVNSDQAVFDSCGFEGYQDTLYALANRQFYTGCNIYGTVDFIFGNAVAVFQNCNVLGRLPLPNQQNTFTAQGRKVSDDPSGFSFHKCTIGANSDLQSSSHSVRSYFGRPWKAYSRTVFLQCNIAGIIDPAGWVAWDATNPFTDTLYYGEYQNTGPGAGTSKRIAWKGVHPAMTLQEASEYTVAAFISGPSWLPEAKVAFQNTLS